MWDNLRDLGYTGGPVLSFGEVLADPHLKHIPVILMTGQPSLEAAAEAVEYGAFRYLTKPLDNVAFVVRGR